MKGSILQYFQPSLRYHLSLRSLFCLFLSGRLGFTVFFLGNSEDPDQLASDEAIRYIFHKALEFIV